METSTNKRPLESGQRMDTFAVCTNCSCLSHNLLNCEKCGSPLSSDNESLCYSAEPKRSRLQPAPLSSHSNSANGNGSSVVYSNNARTIVGGLSVVPTPQTLFVNKNAVSSPPTANNSTGVAAVRPQALFVNLNNQARAIMNVTSQSTVTTTVVTSVAPPRASIVTAPSTTLRQTAAAIVNSAETRLSRPSELSSVMASLGHISSLTSDHRSSTASAISSASNGQLVSSNHQSNAPGTGPNASTMEVTINAYQIRIGTRKFVPISPVSFKEDGILFTLKGYTLAPVLLNARAIMICKANLIFCHYPVLFLYLENSCMQQIRNIFQLREDEFSEDTTYALKRCITIFPNVTLHTTSTTCILAENIVKIFSSMAKKYPRYNKILEIISPEMSLDMLLAVHALNGTSSTSSVVGSNMMMHSAAVGTVPVVHSGATTVRNMMRTTVPASAVARAPVMTAVAQQPSALLQSPRLQTRPVGAPTSHYPVYRAAAAPPNSLPPSSGNRSTSYPPTLVVPTDPNRWAQMQKNLVSGGVYHVKMPTGQPKYCLWDGTKLVPCLVQNTEVQLDCTHIRIGMLKGNPVGQIRVMTDQSSGIYLKLNNPNCGIMDIFLTSDDIQHCYLCSEGKVTAIFVSPTRVGVDKLRAKFKLKAQGRAIVFNPSSSEEHQKHLILFLKRINNDQKEALLQVKHPNSRSNLFEMIDVLKAYKILTKIKQSARVQSNINDYFSPGSNTIDRQSMSGNSLEIVVQEITCDVSANDDSSKSKQNNDVEDDDDDDDVIMTSEEIGIKCPYTQQVMKEPMRNKLCGHNYEKMAILEFIVRKKGNAKCPYAGCGNVTPLRMDDLALNTELKAHIEKQLNERSKTHQTQIL